MFEWLHRLTDLLVFEALALDPEAHLTQALHFFIYDSIKIMLLLVMILFVMGLVNSFFPVERVRNFLSRNRLYGGEYLMASAFGVVTPFCSCSSVPLFIGFVKGGIPLGVTFAFLITSPLVNEVAIGLFIGAFGLKTTLIYIAGGMLLGMSAGWILSRFHLEHYLTPWVQQVLDKAQREETTYTAAASSWSGRLRVVAREALSTLRGIAPYVVAGIAIGGLMHGYVPEGFFARYMGPDNPFAVPLASIMAVPMYANASGVLPIVQVLVEKGIPLGTAIAFMMGVVGLSLPEAMLLKKVMRLPLIGIFFGVVTACIVLAGYAFNVLF